MSGDTDIDELVSAAIAAMDKAYTPYSNFPVGAALRGDSGVIYAGCNVENAAYPVGQCAEANAIGAMVAAGLQRIQAVLVIGGRPGDDALCTPCGACRQRIREFAPPEAPIYICGPEGLRRRETLATLLPLSFGPENLGG